MIIRRIVFGIVNSEPRSTAPVRHVTEPEEVILFLMESLVITGSVVKADGARIICADRWSEQKEIEKENEAYFCDRCKKRV